MRFRSSRWQVDNSPQGRRKREIAPQLLIRSLLLADAPSCAFLLLFFSPSVACPVAISKRVEIRYSALDCMQSNQWHLFRGPSWRSERILYTFLYRRKQRVFHRSRLSDARNFLSQRGSSLLTEFSVTADYKSEISLSIISHGSVLKVWIVNKFCIVCTSIKRYNKIKWNTVAVTRLCLRQRHLIDA